MPELPEIETVKLQLQQVLPGKVISDINVLKERTVIGDWKQAVGKKVLGIKRKGKVLIVDLHENISIAFHFKMTGQLVYDPKNNNQAPNSKIQINSHNQNNNVQNRIVGGHPTKDFTGELPSKHTRVEITLTTTFTKAAAGKPSSGESAHESTLYFNDQRLFGWMRVGTTEDINQMTFLEKMGPEIWEIDTDKMLGLLKNIKRPIKLAIMDQTIISGVGNIYANDALWEAGIDPRTVSSKVPKDKIQKLIEAIRLVLEEGIKYGGATAADAKYIDLHGLGGHYQDHFRVYDRKGEKCLRTECQQAGGVIEKIQMGGRGTYWCPVCQK